MNNSALTYAYTKDGKLVSQRTTALKLSTTYNALKVVNRVKDYENTVKLGKRETIEFLRELEKTRKVVTINYIKRTNGEAATLVGAIMGTDGYGYLTYKDFEIERKLRTHSKGDSTYTGGNIYANSIKSIVYNKTLHLCQF